MAEWNRYRCLNTGVLDGCCTCFGSTSKLVNAAFCLLETIKKVLVSFY